MSKEKPAVTGTLITKSDSTVYNPPFRAFMIETSGDLKIRHPGNQAEIAMAYVGGSIYPIESDMFFSTGSDDVGRILAFR